MEYRIQKENLRLDGQRIYLRPVVESDATDEYARWLNDPEVNQFLESRFSISTKESVQDYIKKQWEDPNTLFLAIVLKENGKHIGNIKLGPMNWYHNVGDI